MREKQRATQVEAYSMVVMIYKRCIANGVLLGGVNEEAQQSRHRRACWERCPYLGKVV